MKIQLIERFFKLYQDEPVEIGRRQRTIELDMLPPRGSTLVFGDGEEVQIHKDAEVKVFVSGEPATYDFATSEDFQDHVQYKGVEGRYYELKEALEAYAPDHPEWEWDLW